MKAARLALGIACSVLTLCTATSSSLARTPTQEPAQITEVPRGGHPFGPHSRPTSPSLTVEVAKKELRFSWTRSKNARYYKLLSNPDGSSGYRSIARPMPTFQTQKTVSISGHLLNWEQATYILVACNKRGCTNSNVVDVRGHERDAMQLVFAAPARLAVSADGSTLVAANFVHAVGDFSEAGSVFIHRKRRGEWQLEKVLTAPTPDTQTHFGREIALSADGRTLAIGAHTEPLDVSWPRAGAVFVYRRSSTGWVQHSKLTIAPREDSFGFGLKLDISAAGNVLAVGSPYDEAAVNGTSVRYAGSTFIYRLKKDIWQLEARLRSAEPEHGDLFGAGIALSGNGRVLAVLAAEVNQLTTSDSDSRRNTLHTFQFNGHAWKRSTSIEAPEGVTTFGGTGSEVYSIATSKALDIDWRGRTIAIGAVTAKAPSGAGGFLMIYERAEARWAPTNKLEASVANRERFGEQVVISGDGRVIAATAEASGFPYLSRSVVVYRRTENAWEERSVLRSLHTSDMLPDNYGGALAISFKGRMLSVGAARYLPPDPNDPRAGEPVVYIY